MRRTLSHRPKPVHQILDNKHEIRAIPRGIGIRYGASILRLLLSYARLFRDGLLHVLDSLGRSRVLDDSLQGLNRTRSGPVYKGPIPSEFKMQRVPLFQMKRLPEFFRERNLPILIHDAFHEEAFHAGSRGPLTIMIVAVGHQSVNENRNLSLQVVTSPPSSQSSPARRSPLPTSSPRSQPGSSARPWPRRGWCLCPRRWRRSPCHGTCR